MSKHAVEALKVEIGHASQLIGSLTAQEWAMASDCAGWRVQDLVAHMSATFKTIGGGEVARVEPPSDDAERNADAAVDERRGWSSADVASEYAEWSEKGLAALAGMNDDSMASVVIPLGNLGQHPMHILANAIVFDHYCHLRHDLLAPEGPLKRPALPADDQTLHAIEEWMLGGLPQMCAADLAFIDRPLNITFTGIGANEYSIVPGSPYVIIEPGHVDDAVATITSGAHEFVSWGTKRRDWRRMGVTVSGDKEYAARVLDAVNVI